MPPALTVAQAHKRHQEKPEAAWRLADVPPRGAGALRLLADGALSDWPSAASLMRQKIQSHHRVELCARARAQGPTRHAHARRVVALFGPLLHGPRRSFRQDEPWDRCRQPWSAKTKTSRPGTDGASWASSSNGYTSDTCNSDHVAAAAGSVQGSCRTRLGPRGQSPRLCLPIEIKAEYLSSP